MQQLPPDMFREHRVRLGRQLGGRGLVMLAGNHAMQSRHDASYSFEQESNFWYLSGIDAQDWILAIDYDKGVSTLFAPSVSQIHQTFDGSMSMDEASAASGIQDVRPAGELPRYLEKVKKSHERVYGLGQSKEILSHADYELNSANADLKKQLRQYFKGFDDVRRAIATVRTIKSSEEVGALRQAVSITAQAFQAVLDHREITEYEYQVDAQLTYGFRYDNAKHAYSPIVAGGARACTLHYGANDQAWAADELLLIDAGARVGYYGADVTRTYAHSKPSARQQAVLDEVHQAQADIIALLEPGLSFRDYQDQVDEIMFQSMRRLGLVKKAEQVHQYMPHAVSHGLGVDVHDQIAGYTDMQPGMVLTVEPGVYIPGESIGVRVEDDIVITEKGHENLSGMIPYA